MAAVYSYFGPQRIKKVVGSTTTRYIYSGSKPIAEYVNGANASSPSTEYIYAGSQLLVTIAGSTTTYHHPDHLSNRAETNSSGTRTRTFGQLPFGETWYETGTSDKWKFTSYERDSGTGETGLDYANFRYYSSAQGRFMSADLLAGHLRAPESLNRYAYARDPVNNIDPLGLFDEPFETCFSTVGSEYTPPPWCEGHATDTHEPPDYANLGGGGADPGSKPNVNIQALIDCIFAQFGVTLESFSPSEPGKSGSFTGFGDVQDRNHNEAGNYDEFSVKNNVSYPSGNLTIRAKFDNVSIPPGYTVMGYTPPNNPSVNYTASNADPNKFVSLQVKELGNSIGLITNQFPEEVNNTPNSPENNEPGTQLLDCYNKGGPGR